MSKNEPTFLSIYADFFRNFFKKANVEASTETHEYLCAQSLLTNQCIYHFRKKGKNACVRIVVSPRYYCDTFDEKKFRIYVLDENKEKAYEQMTDNLDTLLHVFEILIKVCCQ